MWGCRGCICCVQHVTMILNKDHGGAGHICGTSLYIALLKTYFLIMDTYFDARPLNPTNESRTLFSTYKNMLIHTIIST